MPKCCVKKCKNNTLNTLKKDGVSYFRFPKQEVAREKWRKIIAEERGEEFFKPNESSVVCSCHFLESDMYYTKKGYRKLNKGAFPCIEIGILTTSTTFTSVSQVNEPSTSTVSDNSEIGISTIPTTSTSVSLSNEPSKSITSDKLEVVDILTKKLELSKTTTTTTLSSLDNKPSERYARDKSIASQSKTEANEIVKIAAPNEQILGEATTTRDETGNEGSGRQLNLTHRHSPSPTSSGLTSVLDTPKTSYYKKSLRICQKTIDLKNKQIQNLRKKNKRLIKKNLTLKEIVADLKKNRLVDESLSNDLTRKMKESNEKAINMLLAKKTVSFAKYPPEFRKFALTLHFYSPAAYKYLRDIFSQNLPHPNTLFRWYKNVDAQPGFTEEAFLRLADKAKASSEPLLCSLVVDEMSIRQQKTWTGRKFEGLVDLGIGHDDSEMKATQAYVFVVVSLNQSWTLPVAYFFIHSLTGEMKANMVQLILQKCHDVGVEIVSLTFDGCKTNLNCMKVLGCNLEPHDNMKTTFPHPCGGNEVAVFLDACHMVKLMRNLLEAQKRIYDAEGQEIKWGLILALHNLQEENSLHLANKLSVRHINFRNEVMKVKLATQLLSNSVAKAIEFCDKQLHIEHFSDSDATVKFIKTINDLFDILNTRRLSDFGYNMPLNEKNSGKVLDLCNSAKTYLLSLSTKTMFKKTKTVKKEKRVVYEAKMVPLYKCRANTGVIGLLTCINSVQYLYTTLIATKRLSFLTTYKFSQDHVELFFGKIRSLGGHNNNPNTRQFKSAYKKLLAHVELSKKFSGNCLPLENIPILNSGESTAKINNTTTGIRREDEDEENISKAFLENRKNQETVEERYNSNCDHLSELLEAEQNNVTDQIVGYISGFVVYHLLKKINCDDCKNHLLATEKEWFHKLVDIKDVGGLCYASKDVYLICSKSENVIRHCIKLSGGKSLARQYDGQYLTMKILRSLVDVKIFTNTDAHTNDQFHHIYELTKAAVRKYIDVRLHYICKKENVEKKNTSKRQVYNKLNLFQGT